MNWQITKIVTDLLGKEGVVNSRASGHWTLSDEQFEKFAELIIRECAWAADFADNEPGDYVLKHFGVEE